MEVYGRGVIHQFIIFYIRAETLTNIWGNICNIKTAKIKDKKLESQLKIATEFNENPLQENPENIILFIDLTITRVTTCSRQSSSNRPHPKRFLNPFTFYRHFKLWTTAAFTQHISLRQTTTHLQQVPPRKKLLVYSLSLKQFRVRGSVYIFNLTNFI